MAVIPNPGLAFGYTAPDMPQGWEVDTFVAGAAVSANYVVAHTGVGKIRHAVSNGGVNLVLGVALDAAATDKTARVARRGPVTVVKDGSNLAANDFVRLSATTNGVVAALGATDAVTQAQHLKLLLGIVMAAATTGDTSVNVFLV